ncbi:MutS-related protein [Alistipes sp.]|uniref:MutS-related protein n=1 Tax=Alistipes sp. TaxID=1872444 RepID=UPI003AF14C8F
MKISDPFAALLLPKGTPPAERNAYDFGRIGSYFYNSAPETACLQTVDAETTSDLDLNAVFERIDRTTSRVGQQYLYARLRTLRGEEETAAFGRDAERFAGDPALAARCSAHLKRLSDERAYDLQNLIFDTPARVRGIRAAYLFSALAVASLAASFFHPLFLLLFAATFAANLYIHYDNKLNITLYAAAVKQLAEALRTARRLAAEEVPGTEEAAESIRLTSTVERRSRIVAAQGDGGNELLAVAWLAVEFLKIAFNIEVILFHRFIGSIVHHREAIHGLFRFIGRTDAAIAVMRLRSEGGTCRPRFVEGKYLAVTQAVHPLIDGCVANTLTLDGSGLLLTGSNMSGKTTFIRTLLLNALLAETIDTCFAEAYTAPYMKLFTSIRVTDDLSEGTSYYLQEVLIVKRFLDAAEETAPCLFALDELFKGTNTTERIAAGKAVLARLNRGPHVVLCSTHDVELAFLLHDDRYELHHFREEVTDGELVFDYRLHTGPLTTRNAIRILELYDYPPELIREAMEVQKRLAGTDA